MHCLHKGDPQFFWETANMDGRGKRGRNRKGCSELGEKGQKDVFGGRKGRGEGGRERGDVGQGRRAGGSMEGKGGSFEVIAQ